MAVVRTRPEPVGVDAPAVDPGGVHRFEPRWACRITGPGHVGHMPRVSVPMLRPRARPGTLEDAVVLEDGRTLRVLTTSAASAGGAMQALVRIESANDGGTASERAVTLRAEHQPFLFADGHGAGLAFWDGTRIVAERIGAAGDEVLVARALDLTRECPGPASDALRLWPVFPRALAFPRVAGMIPSVADARYTLARVVWGVCVVRLEGEGPWGRVYVDAMPDGVMTGLLSLSESINPVTCARVPSR